MGAYMFILRFEAGRVGAFWELVLLDITIATDPYTAIDPDSIREPTFPAHTHLRLRWLDAADMAAPLSQGLPLQRE
jgi:hypothetical protein